MGRPSRTRRLALWMNGERVGTWRVSPAGDELSYETSWLASPQARPLSLSLPFWPRNLPPRGDAARAFFENLRAESKPIRDRPDRQITTETNEAFDRGAEVGPDHR